MSDFIADLREPQIPTVCEDLDSDDFVAELRPQRFNIKADPTMELNVLDCQGHSQFPSDEHVQGLVSTSHFSTEKTAELIQSSALTLIKKLLFGRSIAHIEGQIKIELDDMQQSPIFINFDHHGENNATSLKRNRGNPLRDVTDTFNVKVRSGDRNNLHPQKHLQETVNGSDFTPLEFVGRSYLVPRRGSDADSGYGGKISDDMVDQLDAKTPRSERSCSSVDTLCTMLESELRYQREPSCEKSPVGPVSPASDTWEELDEESSVLVIDESYDPEANNEPPSSYSEKSVEKSNEFTESNSIIDVPQSALTTQKDECSQDACHVDSQQRSSSLPVDLSGDSEDPRGCLSPQAQNLVICSDMSPHGLVCRLCHTLTKSAFEMSEHAAQTHNLFSCMCCFQSFSRKSHLESHMPVHSNNVFESPNHPVENMDVQVPEMYAHSEAEEQVLDLSVKKPGHGNEARPSGDADLARALSTRLGQNVSRDGYGQPGRDSAFSTVSPISSSLFNQPTREMMRLQSFDGMTKGLVSIKIEPGCEAQLSPPKLLSLPGTPLPHLVECKAEEHLDRSQVEEPPRMPSENFTRFAHTPQGKHHVRFNPYSRERMAELTAKFIASRKIAPGTGRHEETQVAQGVAKMDDEISREVSLSETTLKNRVNAFVKNGGHQAQLESSPKTSNISSSHACGKDSESRGGSRHGAARPASSGSFTCNHEGCGEEFACFQALERHSVDSHGRYLCEHCGKTFTARPNRDRHVRYHTGERPYKCDLCPLAFFRGDDLKYHRTTRHPAAEPFVCKRCNRNFTWNRDLERHQRHCRCKA